MVNKKCTRVGAEAQYDPRTVGEILHNYLENSNEPLARAYREHSEDADPQLWHRNTDLAVDLKTVLRSDHYMKTGKTYAGLLRRDADAEMEEFRCRDAHYTFVETVGGASAKRNPQLFNGRYITITRQDDGQLRPNFKRMPAGMTAGNYAFEVYRELRRALIGLVEKVRK